MTFPDEESLRKEYGSDAVFSYIDDILVVHLDCPSKELIRKRTDEVRRQANEPDDCPLCEMEQLRGGYTVVYDGQSVWQHSEVKPWVNEPSEPCTSGHGTIYIYYKIHGMLMNEVDKNANR